MNAKELAAIKSRVDANKRAAQRKPHSPAAAPTTRRRPTRTPSAIDGELLMPTPHATEFVPDPSAGPISVRSAPRRSTTTEQLDFFPIALVDASLKSDFATLEHPFFGLSKVPDTSIRKYEHNGNSITITPSTAGICTIWDKDVLIYAASALSEEVNRGGRVSRTLRIHAHDFLRYAKRSTGKRAYDLLTAALERLAGTRIKTDITTGGTRKRAGFGMIDSWKIIERTNGKMSSLEITLSEWFFDAVVNAEVLTLNRRYFELTGGIERRLYELARKHVGRQTHPFKISIATLFKKSGSTTTLREFRRLIRDAEARNNLPDYLIAFDQEAGMVTFSSRIRKTPTAQGAVPTLRSVSIANPA